MRVAALLLAAAASAAALADAPVIKIERGEACVAPAEEMRRNHMKMLFHQRDRTMREGVRTTRFSLKGCVDCHASAKTGSVLGKDGFCSSCHEYVAVKIDCFECHTPDRQKQAAASEALQKNWRPMVVPANAGTHVLKKENLAPAFAGATQRFPRP